MSHATHLLQRKCACGGTPGPTGECAACRKKREIALQRAALSPATGAGSAPPIVHEVLRSPGQPLDPATRAWMEPRFGRDFGSVRVHTDGQAAASAQSVNALAYTVGQDIVFGGGHYAPTTRAGRHLLAHELAHTIQQRSASARDTLQTLSTVDTADSPLEREADTAAAQVLAGERPSVAGMVTQARPQRQADSARHTMQRPMPDGHIEVTRTSEQRPCRQIPRTESTPARDMVYFDAEASAFGIRYRYCRGTATIELDSQARYDRLRRDAEQLLRNLPQTVIGGGDVFAQIRQTAEQTSISASTTLAVTVSGTLRAEVRGSTEQGAQTRSYEVEGLFRLTPRGWALELGASYRHVADQLQGTVDRISFTPRVNVGPVQAGVTVEHTEEQPRGGAPASTTTVRGTVSVATGRGLGLTLSGSSENGGTFSISFGTVDRSQSIPDVPRQECFTRDCPPPRVRYSCTRVRSAHPEEVEVQSPGHQVVQLHYQLDRTTPADPGLYTQRLEQIAGLVRNNFNVQSIEGFASPEASQTYNQDLSQRRADQASADIRTHLSGALEPVSATLPTPRGGGELLGESTTLREARNSRLIAEISARLAGLSEDQQAELLGIDPASLDEAGRADLRQRIQAFTQGRALGERARWERIFPFLRRVEVTLDRPRLTREIQVPERREASSTCDRETLVWAERNFPPLPRERRLPDRPTLGF